MATKCEGKSEHGMWVKYDSTRRIYMNREQIESVTVTVDEDEKEDAQLSNVTVRMASGEEHDLDEPEVMGTFIDWLNRQP